MSHGKEKMKTKEIQKSILRAMLKKNPYATVAETAQAYEALKKFVIGEMNDNSWWERDTRNWKIKIRI